MFILPIINKLIKILRSQGSPTQIAWAVCLGMGMALLPTWTLIHVLILLFVIGLNVNIGAFLFGFSIFKILAFVMDPLLHNVGYYVLVKLEFLSGFFATLENLPVFPFTYFNNTVVMGGLIMSLIFFVPLFFGIRWIVINYREKIDPRLEKLKIVQILKSSKLYKLYKLARDWRQA